MKVWNKRQNNIPSDAVYVGRPTKWGNPFTHMGGTLAKFVVANRDEAVDQYEQWLLQQPELVAQAKKELVGKDLICWCAPQRCHADVLMKVANS